MQRKSKNGEMLDRISTELLESNCNATNETELILAMHAAINKTVFAYQSGGETHNQSLIHTVHEANLLGRHYVAEIYSPPRVTSRAHRYNLRPSFTPDLSITDDDDAEHRNFDNRNQIVIKTRALNTGNNETLAANGGTVGEPRSALCNI